jgi:iron complex transport system ATP-binding protein
MSTASTGIRATAVSVVIDGAPIIDDISIEVSPGEVVAVVGPNGAGKSTLLAVLSGDIHATSGTVELCGAAIDGLSHLERARRRSVLTQDN